MILDDFLLWYQMLSSIISTACVMLYCVFIYIVSGCSCVDFHVQLKLEVWRQVEDPSNPGKFYYYNQAWQQKINRWRIEEFDDSPRDNFRGHRWDNLGSSCRVCRGETLSCDGIFDDWCFSHYRQDDFGILMNFGYLSRNVFKKEACVLFCSIIWIRWLDAKKWFSGFI